MVKERKVLNVCNSDEIVELEIKPGDELELVVTVTESPRSITFHIKGRSLSLGLNPNSGHEIYAA
jgi:hypothetical protein